MASPLESVDVSATIAGTTQKKWKTFITIIKIKLMTKWTQSFIPSFPVLFFLSAVRDAPAFEVRLRCSYARWAYNNRYLIKFDRKSLTKNTNKNTTASLYEGFNNVRNDLGCFWRFFLNNRYLDCKRIDRLLIMHGTIDTFFSTPSFSGLAKFPCWMFRPKRMS